MYYIGTLSSSNPNHLRRITEIPCLIIAIIIIIITYSVGIEFEYLIKSQIIIGNELLEHSHSISSINDDEIRYKLSPTGKYIKAIDDIPLLQLRRYLYI